jgi:hypothetical protein
MENGKTKNRRKNGEDSRKRMTNKEFVQSIHPDSYLEKTGHTVNEKSVMVIYDSYDSYQILGFSSYSPSVAWRSAAAYLRREMLEQLESK